MLKIMKLEHAFIFVLDNILCITNVGFFLYISIKDDFSQQFCLKPSYWHLCFY